MSDTTRGLVSGLEGILDHGDQLRTAGHRQTAGFRPGVDSGPEQAFVGVDISDADDSLRIHQEQLYRHAVAAGERVQALGIERRQQRFDAEPGNQAMVGDVFAGPEHGTEPARIAQPQQLAAAFAANHEVEVIMLSGRCARLKNPQASRHPQVQDQMPVAAIHQNVLAAPFDRADCAPRQRVDLGRHRPAQARFAHLDTEDGLTSQIGRNPPKGDLYFGEFGHSGELGDTPRVKLG